MTARTEKQWEEWWAQQFAEISKPEYGLNCTNYTDDFSYPAIRLDTPHGKIQIEHKSDDICKIYWPGGSVGRLWVSTEDSNNEFMLNPDGSYGWYLEPEQDLHVALSAAICLLEWATTKVAVEIAAKQGEA